MYLNHFSLRNHPFSMTPDPGFLYLTNEHREALAALTYAILGRKGFVVLIGEAGTGKTTVLRKVIDSIPASRILASVVLNPTLTPGEFLETILISMGITDIPASKAQRLHFLRGVLMEADHQGKVPVLIVDEAHRLPPDVLEEIRLLSNFEKAECKLIQIVLAGQSELRDILNRDDLRQVKQRVAVRVNLNALSDSDVGLYLQHRWTKAGGSSAHPFSPDSVARIASYSRGTPRVINAVCDNALMLAYARNAHKVASADIDQVAAELDLSAREGSVRKVGVGKSVLASANQDTRTFGAPESHTECQVFPLRGSTEPARKERRRSLLRRLITRAETA